MQFLLSTVVSVWGYDLTYLELAAVLTSLYGVWLGTTGTVWTWPWWAVSSALYALLFYNAALLASAALQFVFIAAALWGWLGWGPTGAQPRVASWRFRAVTAVAGLAATSVLVPTLAGWGAAATWPDSFGLVFSIVAQVLMVKEYRESWALWLVVDAVYTIEYATQGLWFTSVLYAMFTVIALRGWVQWRSILHETSVPLMR